MTRLSKRSALEQGRAEFAYQCAKRASDNIHLSKEYKSLAKKLPMLIKTNGLGATIAFINSKKSEAYEAIYKDISDWLKTDEKNLIDLSKNELIEEIIHKPSPEYRAITIEVMAFLNWLKRFVDGLIQ